MDDGLIREFAAGQVWRYETRPQERQSRLEILKVEREGEERIIHIRVVDLAMLNRGLAGGQAPLIDHLPVTERALRASVIERMMIPASDPGPMPEYHSWREAYELGEAGVFDRPVSELVTEIEEGIALALIAAADQAGEADDHAA